MDQFGIMITKRGAECLVAMLEREAREVKTGRRELHVDDR
jgi:hypothetical protein